MTQTSARGFLRLWLLALLIVACGAGGLAWTLFDSPVAIDPQDPAAVALGASLYGRHCAECHGQRLEGQPDWRARRPDGKLPAPPHDVSGHTWHHADDDLFGMVKEGFATGRYAPSGYLSDMPGYGDTLSDSEIRAVLAYIKSTWPEAQQAHQARISGR